MFLSRKKNILPVFVNSSSYSTYVICSTDTKDRSLSFLNRWRRESPIDKEPVFLPNDVEDIDHLPNASFVIQSSHIYDEFRTYPELNFLKFNIVLIIKFLSALEHFLYKTDNKYMIRMTDDVYINFPVLLEFFEEVDMLRNKNDRGILIIGNCLKNFEIIQGGSGFLLSREAAFVVYKTYTDLIRTVNYYEDWIETYQFMKIIPEIKNLDSPRFMGHGFLHHQLLLVLRGSNYFVECPVIPNYTNCGESFFPVKKTVYFHQIAKYMTHEYWDNFIINVPDNLLWYQYQGFSLICTKIN